MEDSSASGLNPLVKVGRVGKGSQDKELGYRAASH